MFWNHGTLSSQIQNLMYLHTSSISHTLMASNIVDHSDVVGASPFGVASTTSSFSTQHLASMDWVKTTTRREPFKCQDFVQLILEVWQYNSLWSGDIISIMACHLFGAKPLSQQIMTHYQLNIQQQTSVKYALKWHFIQETAFWPRSVTI